MDFRNLTDKLIGEWHGEYHLWLDPSKSANLSPSSAEIKRTVLDRCIHMSYNWEDEGKTQEGLLIISFDDKKQKVNTSWVDSWHQYPDFMYSEGYIDPEGYLIVKGSYAAPKGPKWEWQTKILAKSENDFLFEMYNISPKGESHIAVRVDYSRA